MPSAVNKSSSLEQLFKGERLPPIIPATRRRPLKQPQACIAPQILACPSPFKYFTLPPEAQHTHTNSHALSLPHRFCILGPPRTTLMEAAAGEAELFTVAHYSQKRSCKGEDFSCAFADCEWPRSTDPAVERVRFAYFGMFDGHCGQVGRPLVCAIVHLFVTRNCRQHRCCPLVSSVAGWLTCRRVPLCGAKNICSTASSFASMTSSANRAPASHVA